MVFILVEVLTSDSKGNAVWKDSLEWRDRSGKETFCHKTSNLLPVTPALLVPVGT